jgi:hypothetical protein
LILLTFFNKAERLERYGMKILQGTLGPTYLFTSGGPPQLLKPMGQAGKHGAR